jgi:DNA-binding XRE family transcriptional regulator
MTRPSHNDFKKKALAKKTVKAAYDSLAEEYLLINELIRARKLADKTQEEVAQTMHTTKSAISRLESGGGTMHHTPTLNTLKRYAEAVGCKLQIKLIRQKKHD